MKAAIRIRSVHGLTGTTSRALAATPAVIIVDIAMPKLNGIEAARQIRAQPSPPKIIALTAYSVESLVLQGFAAGCSAFVGKRSAAEELVDAIHEVVAGRWFLSESFRHLEAEVAKRFRG